ncbi:hypothetical protein BU16DRAFT_562373 [Lophium mytilinum]|uniref:Uncharacterized protein n=1 Tax=Lophium mytilinum TaxID=390894 RepID=A0A6A6QRF8_9PEZI|nr:hypothetical protein BU16DRAFT_562373 [Lophium mytilinum]
MPFPFSSLFPQKKRYYHPDFGYVEPRDFHRLSHRADFHPTGYYGSAGVFQGNEFHAQEHQAREMQREQEQEYQRQEHEMQRQQAREYRRKMAREQREMGGAHRERNMGRRDMQEGGYGRPRGRRNRRAPEYD